METEESRVSSSRTSSSETIKFQLYPVAGKIQQYGIFGFCHKNSYGFVEPNTLIYDVNTFLSDLSRLLIYFNNITEANINRYSNAYLMYSPRRT